MSVERLEKISMLIIFYPFEYSEGIQLSTLRFVRAKPTWINLACKSTTVKIINIGYTGMNYQNDDVRIKQIKELLPPIALLEKFPATDKLRLPFMKHAWQSTIF